MGRVQRAQPRKVISAIVLIGTVGLLLDAAFLRLGKLVSMEEGHA